MNNHFKKCKTCGEEFQGCTSCEKMGIFHWKTICCSVECYQIYVQRVLDAREGE